MLLPQEVYDSVAFMASYMAATPNNNGGYDYELVSQPSDRLICKICHLPSRDPYLSVCCGHIFCKSCLDNVKKATTITNACPVCRDEEFETFPNKAVDREVKSLHIYCTNKEKGCEWQGELNDINNHLGNSDGCQFEEVKCSNECGKMIQRQYLTSHVETECPRRKVNCQYCHDTGEHQFIEGQHKEECPKLPLPCPNNCDIGNIPYKSMEAHRKECPLEMIQCEYYSVGCEVRMARKDQEKHKKEKMEEHLMMTNLVLNDIKHELTITKHELTETKATLADTNSKFANTESKLTNTNSKLDSQLTDTNNQLAIALQRINTLEVLLYLATDKAVTRPTSSAAVLESSVGWSGKLVALAMMSTSDDQECPIIVKTTEFKNKKRFNIEWYSDPFYTHNKGHKMCLRVDAAGYDKGEGTHLSVYLYLMKGPHDNELTWPLRGKFEMKLLNQISDSEHYIVTVTYDDRASDAADRVTVGNTSENGWGYQQYISNKDLHKITPTSQYLKDDCLFFQVTKL